MKTVFPYLHVEWTVEDWKDFWHTLRAFEERVMTRHTDEVAAIISATPPPNDGQQQPPEPCQP